VRAYLFCACVFNLCMTVCYNLRSCISFCVRALGHRSFSCYNHSDRRKIIHKLFDSPSLDEKLRDCKKELYIKFLLYPCLHVIICIGGGGFLWVWVSPGKILDL
jgi:hypothetical protein